MANLDPEPTEQPTTTTRRRPSRAVVIVDDDGNALPVFAARTAIPIDDRIAAAAAAVKGLREGLAGSAAREALRHLAPGLTCWGSATVEIAPASWVIVPCVALARFAALRTAPGLVAGFVTGALAIGWGAPGAHRRGGLVLCTDPVGRFQRGAPALVIPLEGPPRLCADAGEWQGLAARRGWAL